MFIGKPRSSTKSPGGLACLSLFSYSQCNQMVSFKIDYYYSPNICFTAPDNIYPARFRY